MKTISLIFAIQLSLFAFPYSASAESEAGEVCPRAPDAHFGDRCAHHGKPFRGLAGRICANGFISKYDGDHTAEVRMGTLAECFGKQGQPFTLCIAKYVDAYYKVCPHYRGAF